MGPWTVRVVNDGDVPVRLLADDRLLSFDVTARGERRPFRCELPSVMQPSDPLQRAVVLPAHHAIIETVDPRLYCFGDTAFSALAPGATVVAHLGSAESTARWPAVSPLDDVEPVVRALRSLDAPAVALPDDPTPPLGAAWPHTGAATPTDASQADAAKLTLGGPRAVDAPTAQDIAVPLTLRNEGSRPVTVRFRPDSLGFDVTRAGVTRQCAWPVPPTPANRELYTTIAPHGSVDITLELSAYCDAATLDQPGLLFVTPWLDTRNSSGNAVGIRSFDDLVVATRKTIVRLQHTSAPESIGAPVPVDVASPSP
jgi:hypothetical protein